MVELQGQKGAAKGISLTDTREIVSTLCLSLGSPEGGEWTSDFLRKCSWKDLKRECREKKRGSGEDPSKDEISGQDPWRVA